MPDYAFTNDWFTTASMPYFEEALATAEPVKVLDLGCLDGAFACYIAERFAPGAGIKVHCVDTLAGNPEALGPLDVSQVAARLMSNLRNATDKYERLELTLHQMPLADALENVAHAGGGDFDLLHVNVPYAISADRSAWTAALAITKPGGVVIFDQQLATNDLHSRREWSCRQAAHVHQYISLHPGELTLSRSLLYQSIFVKRSA